MGYAARATNGESPREITARRFQSAAASAIDQHAGVIGQLVASINQTTDQLRVTREFLADLSLRTDALARRLDALERRWWHRWTRR